MGSGVPISMATGMVAAHVNLAGVLLSLRRFDEAERHCRRALELEPGGREAIMSLANVVT